MDSLYDTVSRLLADGEDIVLATIMTKRGSAPRMAGAKMVIRKNGLNTGTIGGGLLEAQVLKFSREVFDSGRSVIRSYNLTGADATSLDMICGGRVEVLLEFLSARETEDVEVFLGVREAVHSGIEGVLFTELPGDLPQNEPLGRRLAIQNGDTIGRGIPQPLLERALQEFSEESDPHVISSETRSFLVEPLRIKKTVFLFGAGHIAQYVAHLLPMLDFRTVVLDDRPEFSNQVRFPEADEVIVLDTFEDCVKHLPISDSSYLVVLTRGHHHDLTVLSQALKTNAAYIGLISSHRKRELIYQALRNFGVTNGELARVYSPIGVPIGAETPSEIALSIAAELVKVRGTNLGA